MTRLTYLYTANAFHMPKLHQQGKEKKVYYHEIYSLFLENNKLIFVQIFRYIY
jgi:hypothetical protein